MSKSLRMMREVGTEDRQSRTKAFMNEGSDQEGDRRLPAGWGEGEITGWCESRRSQRLLKSGEERRSGRGLGEQGELQLHPLALSKVFSCGEMREQTACTLEGSADSQGFSSSRMWREHPEERLKATGI